MFGLFKKDERKALEKRYRQLLLEARDLQRAGKIPEFARKTTEAEATRARLIALDAPRASSDDVPRSRKSRP